MSEPDHIAEAVRAAFLERDRWILVPKGDDGVLVLERSCPAELQLQRHSFDTSKEARAFIWDRVLDSARSAIGKQ